jgi:hypothetical protein
VITPTVDPIACRWVASDQPRVLVGRHDDDCPGETCTGCLSCPWSHCRVCGRAHAEHACPGCVGDVRGSLTQLRRMCSTLPTEVAHRGLDSEAMVLLGPVADPEARGHVEASYKAGRLPEGWLETGTHGEHCPLLSNEACTGCGGGELHPLTVTWWWNECYREALEHPPTPAIGPRYDTSGKRIPDFGVADLIDYLDHHLTAIATLPDVPFEDLGRDLRQCVAHVERVLHDGEQVETGAPCMTCRGSLVRVYEGDELPWAHRDGSKPRASEDVWACARCREWRDDGEYRLNVADVHRDNADWLTDQEMEIRTGIRAGTIREWARDREGRGMLVAKRRDSGRTVYAVADVERVASEKGMLVSGRAG